MSRFLGRSGEKRFSLLCSDGGITCNPAIEDEHGWDHVVQFAHKPVAGVSADMQHRLPAIFVQTKSHEADGLQITMKLSNALSLAKSPNPCFVALATLPADSVVATWHAVHVWGELLERILKRAREESRDGTSEEDFNKKTFSFTMTEADLHHNKDLLPWIERNVRAVGPDYAAAKAALVPPPTIVGHIKIGPLNSIEELIDHTIGLTKHIPIQGFEMGARRLGVDIALSFPVQDGAIFHASLHAHPAGQAGIRMRGPDGIVIDMVADVIVPPNLGLAQDSYKYRFRAPNVDIIWSPSGAATIDGHFDGQHRAPPQELVRALRFVSWAGQGDIDVRVSIEDEPTLGATARMNPLPDREDLTYLAALAEPLARVSQHLKAKIPAISINDVANAEHIEPFHRFVTATDMQANTVLDASAVIPEVSAGVAFGIIQVGEWVFAAIQRFPIIEQRRNGERWSIDFGKPVLLEPAAFSIGDVGMLERFKADYRRLASAPGVLPLDNALVALVGSGGSG
jgi:hypothetical protein